MQLFIIVQSAKCCYTGKIFSLNLAAHKCLFLFNFNIFKVWRKQYMKIIVTSLWFPSAIFFKILNSHTTFLQSWNNAVNFPSPGIEIPIHPLILIPVIFTLPWVFNGGYAPSAILEIKLISMLLVFPQNEFSGKWLLRWIAPASIQTAGTWLAQAPKCTPVAGN